MKYFFVILAFLLVFSGCKHETAKKTLTTGSLKAQEFTINTDRDTTLVTAKGALINIPKGAIVPANGNSISLEVKEAYSLSDIVLAGLNTQSNGEPLGSGGMIYINPLAGQDARIVKPIRVAIPADYRQAGMKLFKGDTSGDNIDWKEPVPLPENAQSQALLQGKTLFGQNCTSCHAIGKDMTGPDLAHFEKRFPNGWWSEGDYVYWAYHYYHGTLPGSTSDTVSHYYYVDPYACNLISLYKGMVAPVQSLKYDEWKVIYDYVQNESDRLNLPLPAHSYLKPCTDSCILYRQAVQDLELQKQIASDKRKDLIEDNNPLLNMIDTGRRTTPALPEPAISNTANFDDIVSPQNAQFEYYQFTIESFGWYNVDILLKDLPGVEPAELFVNVTNKKWDNITVNLILPSVKANALGGIGNSKDDYVFYKKDGKVFLPIGAKGFILALSESGQEMAYGLLPFTAAKSQRLSVPLKKSGKSEFSKAMKALDETGLKISVADTKNADKLRKTDGELKTINENLKKAESLKPKRCDCDCSWWRPTGTLPEHRQ
jgi:mono/diheme cytochrome c family protein